MFAIAGVLILWEQHRLYIFTLEAFLIVTFLVGLYFRKRFGLHLDIVSSGTELMQEGDFSMTFAEVSALDLNRLIELYNKMIRSLRQERLRNEEQHAFLQKVMQASTTGIIALNLEGRIVLSNPSAQIFLTGSETEIENKGLNEIVSDIADKIPQIDIGKSEVINIGNHRKLQCMHSQYYERGFARSFFILIELTEELRKTERTAYETLIRTLAHEVNNTIGASNSILRSSLNYAVQLEEQDRLDFTNALTVAIERAENLNTFMRGYADVIQLPEPVKKQVDVREILNRIVTIIRPECVQRNIEIVEDVGKESVFKSIDINQFEQALLNIVRNSIEAIENKGTITLSLQKLNDRHQITIEDTGSGLNHEAEAKLFTPFFSTKPNGQGIGLTLVNEIFSRHNLEFSLERNSNDLTQFSIWFD